MLIDLQSKSLSNNSATSGFVWHQFDFDQCTDQKQSIYIWGFCIALCFALGFPTSVAILWEMFKTHRRGTPFTPYSFFALNCTVMDVVFLAFIPPGLLNHLIWEIWPIEATWNGFYALNVCRRPLLMACMCLDCFVAVVHPITYHKRKNLTPRVVMAGIVWILMVASGIAYFLFYKLNFSMFATVPFIIAIVTIGICDSFILHTLIKSDLGQKTIHLQKQRAIQTLINSLVMTVVSYLPPVVLLTSTKYLISSHSSFVCVIGIPITLTSSSGSAVLPILDLNNCGKLDRFKLGCCRKS